MARAPQQTRDDAPVRALRARLRELTLRDEHRLARRMDKLRRTADDAERAAALAALVGEIERAEARVARRRAAVPAEIPYPPELPVSARRDDLVAAIRDNQVVVVAGETGSGKTTQLPKMCLELGRGVRGAIAHTQPRRIAARTVAERIAEELKVPLGAAVGFAVRFSDRSSEDTLVRVMTDGLLLAEVKRDPLLRRYDTIVVDEAHERSLNIDFLLGVVKRILPRRPDLKLIITSATIDPRRFAAHFGDAPVVEVSGRTYPVELRYRPVVDPDDPAADPDRDQVDAIGDAVDELLRERRGDILVFLSGEREIRDTADALRGRFRSDKDPIEILPLYARLSSAEQQRIFRRNSSRPTRRIVLATNVAETSLTVPGITYVIDPGTARISRYSARLKVQRLPIERISQASAGQRKGRCGRTSEGVCIRLYGEEDFLERPRFTDPEILRTNLASVILQMAAADLGDIEDFPFLDPPDRRQIRDGVNLLTELRALDAGRLTPIGRRLAGLPVDPRFARMVIEADRLGCANEVIVIAAGLSIQDPRERPAETRQQADQQHARFADETSDLLAWLNLWRYLRTQQRELSGNQFRKRCREEFLHHLRVREWQDLVGGLRSAAREAGVKLNQEEAEPQQIHVAMLAGLLSHVGVKDAKGREYQGARNARFQVFPGSALARRPPAWVMAAELVETSRLWARDVARIEPEWVEPLAEHLVRRTYSEPRWDATRGAAIATERVLLYGLPIVAGRTVTYARIDPRLARELLIRRALVEGDWERARHEFLAQNRRRVEDVQALEERARRRGLLVGDEALFAFFDERIPADVVSGAHFDRWWRDERRAHPDLLTYPRELLVAAEAADVLDPRARPSAWKQGDLVLPLSYRFEPGARDDGVTAHVPLAVLGRLRAIGFDWLVPAFRLELVTALIRSLPKELRRPLVPVPDVAAEVLRRMTPRREPLLDALSRELEALRGVRIPRSAWDLTRLPPHLRVHFQVEDDSGRPIGQGDDLAALREQVAPRLRAELTARHPELERTGLRDWTIGTLPREIELRGSGVRAYPALVDEGETAGVRVLETPEAQAEAMRTGIRRLLLLTVRSPLRQVLDGLPRNAQLALAGAPHGSVRAVLEDAQTAAIDALVDEAGGPARDEAGFRRLRDHVAGELHDRTRAIVLHAVRILDLARTVRRRLDSLTAEAVAPARRDVAAQLDRLLPDGFLTATGAARLGDLERYLRAAERRLERLPDNPARDLDRMRAIHDLEALHHRRVTDRSPGRPLPAALRDVPWMLEELRVNQFAQGLGTRGPVSSKRIRRVIEEHAPGP